MYNCRIYFLFLNNLPLPPLQQTNRNTNSSKKPLDMSTCPAHTAKREVNRPSPVTMNTHSSYHGSLRYWLDFIIISLYFHIPLLVALFIILPIAANYFFGVIACTVIILLEVVYFVKNCSSRAHITGDGLSSPWWRSVKTNPLLSASFRYFDPQFIVPQHDEVLFARKACIDAIYSLSTPTTRHDSVPRKYSIETPYLQYFIGTERIKRLKKDSHEVQNGDIDAFIFSHPDLIVINPTLHMNPTPPPSLFAHFAAVDHAMVPTLSCGYIYGQQPHGLYPYTSLWSHHHPDWAPYTNRTFVETEKNKKGNNLIKLVPDATGALIPVTDRYECITTKHGDETHHHCNASTFLPALFKKYNHRYPLATPGSDSPTRVDTLGTSTLSFTPFIREVFSAIGGGDVSYQSFVYRLMVGRSIFFLPGGQREIVSADARRLDYVFYTRHYGAFKIALQTGTPLVPVISFGEDQVLDAFSFPPLQNLLYKLIWLHLPIYAHGAYYTLCPNDVPLTIVVGTPLFLPVIDNPTDDMIRYYHAVYYTYVARLFFTYRDRAGFAGAKLTFQ